MIDKSIKRILLSKRILRTDPFENITWTDEYFPSWISNLGIPNTDIFSCNTLQRRCSCSSVRGNQIILMDNLILELFLIFNQMLEPNFDSKQIEALFCLIIRDSYFSFDNIKYAAIYWNMAKQKISKSKIVKIRPITKDSEPRYIYVQQAFLVAHELVHSWFRELPYELIDQKNIIKDLLKEIFANRYSDIISTFSDSNIEEFCCDHIAVYLTMDISINGYNNSIENSAIAIMLALCHQLAIFCIDQWIAGELKSSLTNVDNFRATIVRRYIRNYVRQYRPDKLSCVDQSLDNIYSVWKEKIFDILTEYLIEQNLNRSQYEKLYISDNDLQTVKAQLRSLL